MPEFGKRPDKRRETFRSSANGSANGMTVTDGAVYDLQGRRVADCLDDAARRWLPTGVYIVGGRKIILK